MRRYGFYGGALKSFSLLSTHEQMVTFLVEDSNREVATFSFVYAKCRSAGRRELWDHITQIATVVSTPWMVGGDFNIMSHDEKLGGASPDVRAMDDFNDAVSTANLIDAGFQGSKYTWCNNQVGAACIRARLDRCFVSSNWAASFPYTVVQHLTRTLSDHAPFYSLVGML